MIPLRPQLIATIFITAILAWFALGPSVVARSGEFDSRFSKQVALTWGGRHTQSAPNLSWTRALAGDAGMAR